MFCSSCQGPEHTPKTGRLCVKNTPQSRLRSPSASDQLGQLKESLSVVSLCSRVDECPRGREREKTLVMDSLLDGQWRLPSPGDRGDPVVWGCTRWKRPFSMLEVDFNPSPRLSDCRVGVIHEEFGQGRGKVVICQLSALRCLSRRKKIKYLPAHKMFDGTTDLSSVLNRRNSAFLLTTAPARSISLIASSTATF
jgi:hypothetical protein